MAKVQLSRGNAPPGDLITATPFGLALFPPYECRQRPHDPSLDGACEATVSELERCYRGLAKSTRALAGEVRCSDELDELPPVETPDVCAKVSDDCAVLLGFRDGPMM